MGIEDRLVGTPPPPGLMESMELGENSEKILELQSLAGKIFETKDLAAVSRSVLMGFCCAFQDRGSCQLKSRLFEHSGAVLIFTARLMTHYTLVRCALFEARDLSLHGVGLSAQFFEEFGRCCHR